MNTPEGHTPMRDPDVLILPPVRRDRHGKARRRPLKLGGHPIIAVVTFGHSCGSDFDHPLVEIGRARKTGEYTDDGSGDFAWRGRTLAVRYQIHRYEGWCAFTGKNREEYAPPSRGFLAPPGKWSRAYAGEITTRTEDLDRDGARIFALVSRALEAGSMRGRASRASTPDELTRLIVGLHRCGVEIRVYNPRIRALREAHRERIEEWRASGTATERAA